MDKSIRTAMFYFRVTGTMNFYSSILCSTTFTRNDPYLYIDLRNFYYSGYKCLLFYTTMITVFMKSEGVAKVWCTFDFLNNYITS